MCWLRFLDDVFCVFTQGQEEFHKFVEYLNAASEDIKFTAGQSLERVNFLDTTVILDPDTRRLYTTVFSKPTDTHDYLHFTSSRPDHCKTGRPKGQLLHIRSICKRDEDFEAAYEKMTGHYLRKGYPKKILDKHVAEVLQLQQSDLLEPKQKVDGIDRVIVILTHSITLLTLITLILWASSTLNGTNWHLLHNCQNSSEINHY
jgi:hypothetical protein